MTEKLKSLLGDDLLFVSILLLLVGVIAFGLGRQSVGGVGVQFAQVGAAATPPPAVTLGTFTPPAATDSASSKTEPRAAVVASKSGTKYHLPDCPGAKQMKEENKVWFDSATAATAAGYTPAANCPGL